MDVIIVNRRPFTVEHVRKQVAALRALANHWEAIGETDRARCERNLADDIESRIPRPR